MTGAADFGLDATGNWSGFKQDDDGDAAWDLNQSRTHNAVNEITDITETVGDMWITSTHDRNGNSLRIMKPDDPESYYSCEYDAWNRLVKVTDGEDTIAEYEYDGRNFRVVKQTHSGGELDETRHFYYNGQWQCLEERVEYSGSSSSSSSGSGTVDRQFIWGLRYIDDLVLRDRDADLDSGTGNLGKTGSGLEERLYARQDPNWNVTALAATDGTIQERYIYDAYGKSTVLTGAYAARASSNYDWEHRFAGYRFDSEVESYRVRHRILLSPLGRWNRRDPIGYSAEGFNWYRYVGGGTPSQTDPLGLQAGPIGPDDPRFFPRATCPSLRARDNARWNPIDAVIAIVRCEASMIDYLPAITAMPQISAVLPDSMDPFDARATAKEMLLTCAQAGENARAAGCGFASCAYQMVGMPAARFTKVEDVTYFWENDDPLTGEKKSPRECWLRAVLGSIQLGGLAYTAGAGVSRGVCRLPGWRGGAPSSGRGSGWIFRPEGTRLKQVGSYWIKEVDPSATRLQQCWARGSLKAQARALDKLGDMAPTHLYKNGKLVMRDVGEYVPGSFWRTWARGSLRLRTPMNDIRPRNIGGPGNLIFDPALHPIQQGAYWTLGGVGTVCVCVQGYNYFGGDDE